VRVHDRVLLSPGANGLCCSEFLPYRSFAPLTDIVGGGKFRLLAGQWTDDTSMALCICESLLVMNCFDALDIMFKFLAWFDDGHMSSTGDWYVDTTHRRR
jgi:ADP-ribosyl-[dinitrogen reductase] hydrolase